MAKSDAVIARLGQTWPKGYDLTLERIGRLLAALGHPERRLPPVIHVAGTNGKGSTIAFLRAMLEASAFRVHAHTSPHLIDYRERYRLALAPGVSRLVADDALAEALLRTESANAGAPITVFELLTAAGFLLFAETPADVLLLEVGLGGRFDATNVVDAPLVSVITAISLDHQAQLGSTVAAIAFEKAGIIKRGRPVVISPNADAVVAVLERVAHERRAGPLAVGGMDWRAFEERGRLVYEDGEGLLDLPLPRLLGRHQIDNAGTAIAALRAAGLHLPIGAIEKGLAGAEWPGRLQRLAVGQLARHAPAGAEIWLDGGHNPGAGLVLADALADFEERQPRPLYLIVGMLTTKDAQGFLAPFRGLARSVFTVPIAGSEAGWPPEDLAETARRAGLTATPMASIEAALEALPREGALRVLLCGSLYLAGEVLAKNGGAEKN